jgi:hypothetical protein
MGIENFIKEAHYKPNDYLGYHVGRELAALHPERAVIQGQNWYFDLDTFVREGQCAVVEQKSVFHHVTTNWEETGKKLHEKTENSWLNVLWQGHLLDVVLISWNDGCYRKRHHWIVAEERKTAEDFFRTVCEWCCEVRGEILVFHDGYFQKDKQLFNSIKSATFDNLILLVADPVTSLSNEIQFSIRKQSVKSVAHRVDHHVDSDLVSRQSILHRIGRIVNPFPRIAEVAVARDKRNEAAVFVFNAHVVRNDAAFF